MSPPIAKLWNIRSLFPSWQGINNTYSTVPFKQKRGLYGKILKRLTFDCKGRVVEVNKHIIQHFLILVEYFYWLQFYWSFPFCKLKLPFKLISIYPQQQNSFSKCSLPLICTAINYLHFFQHPAMAAYS